VRLTVFLALCSFLFVPLFAVGQCSPSGVASTVNICAPANSATVNSPVTVSAAATAPSGTTVTAMKVYIDSVTKATSTSNTVNAALSLTSGSHALVINAWNNLGAVWSAKSTFTVGSGGSTCTAEAGAVTICSPAAGATVASPVTISAVAGAPSGTHITAMKLYVDNVTKFSTATASLNTSLALTAGTHNLVVSAWNNLGAVFSSRVTVSVSGGGGGGSCSPTAGAVTICSPTANSSVNSPVNFNAVAGAPSGSTITAMKLYVDGVSKASSTNSTLTASVAIAAGTHSITVNAWNNLGAVIGAKETISVTTVAQPGVSVSPASATVLINQTKQFTATVTGLSDTSVSWSVDGVAGGNSTVGTVDGSGLYSAPGIAGSHTVTATSNADSTKSDGASVDVVTSLSNAKGVFTYMYNNGRTGLNASETKLTIANVTNGANFGFKTKVSFDGTVQAQPLYAPNVSMASGPHNVIYIATENDSVYALDAAAPTTVLWKRNLIPSGATIGRSYSCSTTCDGRTGLGSSIGITGTPVIDPNSNRLYVVAKSTENSAQVYRLHALDLRTGDDATPSEVLKASGSGTGEGSVNGTIDFNALTENQRPGLLLQDGIVYITFAAYSDDPPYHGWVLAYNASDLSFISSFITTPNSGGGGIWMSGAAPAGDSDGNVYIATGNQMPYSSPFPDIPTEIPNSIIKLKLVGSTLSLVDYFVPYNTKCLTNDDLDLGSSAPMVLPDSFNGTTMVAVGSKEGRAYLLDKNNLGKFHASVDSQILSSVLFNPTACGAAGFQANYPLRVYGAPAYWNGNVYLGSVFGPLRQYSITANNLQQVSVSGHQYDAFSSASTIGQSGRGPLTSISSNGNSDAIVWTSEVDTSGAGWLRAYKASAVSTQLFSVNFGSASHFTIPVVANGNVYVTGKNVLYIYGTLR
jgi:hypothetical protein